jgi:hypothetical protein
MSQPDTPCPICSRELVDAQSIFVCSACHASMQSTGAIAMHVTGEFPAVSQLAVAPSDAAPVAPQRPRTPTIPANFDCSWCGKPGDQVKKLLTQGPARICNECVALCSDILQAELGEDWR